MNFIKEFGKQIAIGIVALAIYWGIFGFGGLVMAAIWFVIGALAGNFFPALEARAEQLIAKKKG